jgi:hypothetical protein
VSWSAFGSRMALWSALGRKSLLCIVRSESVLLLCQDVKLVLDCKVGLGVDNRPGGGILVWESGKELFEEHLFCKCVSEAIVPCYNPHSCRLKGYPCVFDLVSFGSLNAVIFAMSSRFACGRTLLYFSCSLFHFSLTVANSRMRSASSSN